MKKILLILLVLLLPVMSYAAPTTTYQRNLLPEITNTYDLGSASKVWNNSYIKNLTISGTCTGCGGGGGGSTTSTLQDVTTNGNTTTNQIQFAGGTSTAAFTIQGLLTASTGSFTYTDATTTNATFATVGTLTGSNATITNVSSTNMSVSSSLSVTGMFSAQTTTLGTVTAGTWAGSSIATTYTDAKLKTLTGTTNRITVGGTATDPTVDISTSYAGQNTITTLGTVATGVWNGTKISEAYGGTNQSTYTLGDTLYASAANTLSKLPGNTATTRKFYRQTGDGANSAAPAWDTITAADISGSALTKTDDTNVTLTLGGSPTTALLNATSLTLGWTGQLGLTRGGTGASLTASNGGMVYSTGSALAILAGTATAGQIPRSGANAAPSWSTATYPATAGTAGKIMRSDGTNFLSSTSLWPDTTTVNQILYSSAANTISGITTVNSGVLITSGAGVPSIATDIPTAVTLGGSYIYRAGGTDVPVADGGTGASTLAAHGVVIGNGTAAVNVTGAGTANQVLTSNGASADPTFQNVPQATFSSSSLSSTFNITGSSGTYQDTGLSISLPSAGTYRVSGIIRFTLVLNSGSAAASMSAKLYNSTDAADVGDYTISLLGYNVPTSYLVSSAPYDVFVTVNGAKTLKLYAARFSGTNYFASSIDGADTNGSTHLNYQKVSN